jgi:hypothetical protein
MCFLTTLVITQCGNPVSDASEVRRANIWLMIPSAQLYFLLGFIGNPLQYAP